MDADHLDIYGTAEAMEDAFIGFAGRLKKDGWLLTRYGLKRQADLKAGNKSSYHLQDNRADVYSENIRIVRGSYFFDVNIKNQKLENLVLHMGGVHNVENATAAIAVARHLGIGDDLIREAVKAFRGVKRRFEYIIKSDDLVFVDDYAHHPEELRALITGARQLFGNMECTVIFQPHLYSRTRDLADGFAESLCLADKVYVLPVYPAREKPIPGVSSDMIVERMKNNKARTCSKQELMELAENGKLIGKKPALLISAGAGDIDAMVLPVKELLKK